jgi:ABC-type amino acid transport substrate-binding protein
MTPSHPKTSNHFGLLLMVLALLVAGQAGAQEPSPKGVLRVGTTNAPPFALKAEDGNWHGISIQLWRELAADLELEFQLQERTFTDLLEGVEDGSLDVGMAAITITSDREVAMDFTHAFYTTGLGIAVAYEGTAQAWLKVAERFLSLQFLYVIAALLLFMFIAGFLVWLFERRHNPEMFGGTAAKGVGSGFWWSAVTMMTVGYGDKAPKTLGGRVVALVWMFTSIIILASATAAITSSLTISELGGPIEGFSDLRRVRVGTVEGTSGAAFLEDKDIVAAGFAGSTAGLQALADGEIDAFVQDAPILKYLVNKDFRGRLQVLPQTFARQYYGIALPSGSDLREPLNRSLLRYIQTEDWRAVLERYLEP